MGHEHDYGNRDRAGGMIGIQSVMPPAATLRSAIVWATGELQAADIGEPRSHAELLLLHVLGISRSELLRDFNEPFPEVMRERWLQLLSRKHKGEPLQYITGEQWFYGRAFQVSPAVLIPRPETELLVEAVLEEAAALGAADTPLRVVDVGTGSGAIAVTLAAERPYWRLVATDISPAALEMAQANAVAQRVAERMQWVQGDFLQPFLEKDQAAQSYLPIDILISNPPYIPAADIADLQVEVRAYEPHLALVGDEDQGLAPYQVMLEQIARLEQTPTIVAFELGIHQPAIVAEWMEQLQLWDRIRIITDYGGIDRHIIAVRQSAK